MINIDRRRKDIIRTINMNPTNITITSIKKTEIDGAFEETETEIKCVVRIFNEKTAEKQTSSEKQGTFSSIRTYGMLVSNDVILEVNSRDSLEFECIYGRMKIVNIYPQIVKGELCGYQCSLERID
ncbi:TPA: hypothetical protein ACMVTQ_003556 [Clostridioides difficile]|uniref:hypothetical protein n=1 Tax=Clostridioides difficile TaxID=1496 RepID=UPI00038D041C|nr:hypothetical protein [Clostridioides difficile]EQG78564.1 hypothetical protein QKA_0345 [Clostridioides difficile DA00165]EAA0008363.1 hypothetical protein [Clostridioides difficile]EGT3777069.1 hypothetical protein [Clostridioides difficile]EGT3817968.1 hypothetical protein [Clostridioides difficile]EGT3855857.1 hypothetical protein [Clostridioides difficile]